MFHHQNQAYDNRRTKFMTIEEQRLAVKEEALTWQDTPYHPNAGVKGAGVCCAWFIAAVFNIALNWNIPFERYFEQWYMNDINIKEKRELYLNGLLERGWVIISKDRVKMSDLVLSRTCNKLYCHGGIIADWPAVIHVNSNRGVEHSKSLYSSWFFGQNPDSLIFLTRKEWVDGI